MTPRYLAALVTLPAFLVLLSGCARTASTRFYTLSPAIASEAAAPAFPGLADAVIGVGPVNLPDYLDRPQIVIRSTPNELRLAEFHSWAGSLKQAVPRIIALNLAALSGSEQVFPFPWKSALPIRYQIVIDIHRFDAQLAGHAELQAQWTAFGDDGRTALMTRKSDIRIPVTAGDYAAAVLAESRALSALSREIAAALSDIHRPQDDPGATRSQ